MNEYWNDDHVLESMHSMVWQWVVAWTNREEAQMIYDLIEGPIIGGKVLEYGTLSLEGGYAVLFKIKSPQYSYYGVKNMEHLKEFDLNSVDWKNVEHIPTLVQWVKED